MTQLKTQAIQTALTGDWTNAILHNKTILEESPEDIDTLNRLAFALTSIGEIKEAKSLYQQVLTLDAQNPIALRNLKRLHDGISPSKSSSLPPAHVSNLFIEEPGRTKVIELLNVADKKVIAPLRSGETLLMVIKRMKIFMLDHDKQYIGMLPDDIGRRLIRFMDDGNQYEAYVKSVDGNKVTIFAREVKKTSKFKNQPSFLPTDRTKLQVTLGSKTTNKNKKAESDLDDQDGDDDSSGDE